MAQACGGREWQRRGVGRSCSRTGAEQSCGLWTGQRCRSVTQEIKPGESKGLDFSLGVCFYT